MSAQHTPTPWMLSGPDGDVECNPKFGIRGSDGKWVATIEMHGYTPMLENAAFIVRACNVHDELVAALQMVCDSGATLAEPIERAMLAALAKAGAA